MKIKKLILLIKIVKIVIIIAGISGSLLANILPKKSCNYHYRKIKKYLMECASFIIKKDSTVNIDLVSWQLTIQAKKQKSILRTK
jgi:hypothetical protein